MDIHSSFVVLLIILALGIMLPELFKKLHLPFITGIILAGAILGPNAIDIIEIDQVIEFFGFMGMIFLMLLAGLDTDLNYLKKMRYKIFVIAGFNGLIPFFVGFLITTLFGYDMMTSLMVGVIFISSSVAIIITILKSSNLFSSSIGQITATSILMLDAISLLALTLIIQRGEAIPWMPFPAYLFLLIGTVLVVFYYLPMLTRFIFRHYMTKPGTDREVRLSLIVIMAVLFLFSLLEVHPVLSAFIVGVTLSHIIKSEKLYSKISTVGYTFFVPVFFFVVGMELDFSVFTRLDDGTVIILVLIIAQMLSKTLSGFAGGRFIGLTTKDSALYGTVSITSLTTTLAVTYAAMTAEILDNVIVTAIIMITIITTILGPILFRWVNAHIE